MMEEDQAVHTHEAHLGTYTTEELIKELKARNEVGQRPRFENTMNQANSYLVRLTRAFEQRDGGLEYRTVDNH